MYMDEGGCIWMYKDEGMYMDERGCICDEVGCIWMRGMYNVYG